MMRRALKIAFGVVLVVVGIAMLVLPGPGLLAIAGGVALILSQWSRGRRWLARLRVWLRRRYGSTRVRGIESHMPREIVPPADTVELDAIAKDSAPPPPEPFP